MINFSWADFCRTHGIEVVSAGASTAKNNIYIHCPWCGTADRGHHMGLAMDARKPFYACWRDSEHRGRNPTRLVAALLRCTFADAAALVGAENSVSIDDYDAAVGRILSPARVPAKATLALEMPTGFRTLTDRNGKRFLSYLEQRGFDEVKDLAEYYRLRYCLVGKFAQRLIIPIYRDGVLMTWTGRDISGLARLRYDTLSAKVDVAKRQGSTPALAEVGELLFNYDRAAKGGRTLVICEGPFDAIKIDWFCDPKDTAVAVFGMPKNAQIGLLLGLAKRFVRVFVLLDRAATSKSWRLWSEELEAVLGSVVSRRDLPAGVKDPGALPGHDVIPFLA